jgi:hypothetical protein
MEHALGMVTACWCDRGMRGGVLVGSSPVDKVSPELGHNSPTHHEDLTATSKATGKARERGIPRAGGCSPASMRRPRWSAASRRSAIAWKRPTAWEPCTRGETWLVTKESRKGHAGGNSSPGGGGQCLAPETSPKGAQELGTALDGRARVELRWRGSSPMGFDAAVVLYFQRRRGRK